ncbi:uncharacterized protein LOC135681139 [Rhopilema esculentum]|uniref:uncharacterized protein LOC135681139 n=1 Tax=Rhopilema esculentum TaxID=499914 RepID=UPI0031D9402B
MAAYVLCRLSGKPFHSACRAQLLDTVLKNLCSNSSQATAASGLNLKQKEDVKKNDFTLIEYTSGPCTADKIILQADKFGSSLMDCVSSDFVMDKGLAKHFKRAFQHKEILQQSGTPPGKAAVVPYKNCYIYYLVTRERWWDRGCYKYLKLALQDAKEHIENNGVDEVCMGRLGSGVDGLDWMKVRELIKDTFKDTGITIKAQLTR